MSRYCQVAFPLPLFQTFLYQVPEELSEKVQVGSRVVAPLGKRPHQGYVLEMVSLSKEPEFKVKPLISCLDEKPIWSQSFLSFILELTRLSLNPPGLFLAMSEPPALKEKELTRVSLTREGQEILLSGKIRGKRKELLDLLSGGGELSPLYLKRKLEIKDIYSCLRPLLQAGLVEIKVKQVRKRVRGELQPGGSLQQLRLPITPVGLSDKEEKLYQRLISREEGTALLAGDQKKRFDFIRKVLISGFQGTALVLVPMVHRLKVWRPIIEALEGNSVVWHSQLSEKLRTENWGRLASGQVRVVFGTRSALFLPVSPLALILVDEEHDELYHQTESPAFDVREAAEIRARQEKCPLLYTSSCPRVSQYFRHSREGTLINLGYENSGLNSQFYRQDLTQLLKEELQARIKNHIKNSGKVFFFVNRKGYAAYLFCLACGYVARCSRCRIALTLQKKEGELVCRYCGETHPEPESCPVCQNKLRAGKVRGTQFVKERLAGIFPGQQVALLEEGVEEPKSEKLIRKIEAGKIRLVVGTEYSLHRLPPGLFTLIVLVNPESSLNLPDFRAAEKSFFTISKVRELLEESSLAECLGVVDGPEPEVIRKALNRDYEGFFLKELEYRELLNYPPFSVLLELTLEGSSVRRAGNYSRQLLSLISSRFPEVEIIGPRLTRKIWRKEKKEVKSYLRVYSEEQLNLLLETLKEFRIKKPASRLTLNLLR